MKLTQKTYLLLAVIIGVSAVNFYLLISTSQQNQDILHSISYASDLKVIVERIGSTANSIASGNEGDRVMLEQQLTNFDTTYAQLGTGGNIDGLNVVAVPQVLIPAYQKVGDAWGSYKEEAKKIKQESIFDPKVKDDLAYVLSKNGDLTSLTNGVENDLSSLDRNYNRQKIIALEMVNTAKDIGEKTLLYSIGEGRNVTASLKEDRVLFDADLKKLEGLPLDDPMYATYGITPETLQAIPRENSGSIRQLDPLWESVNVKLIYIESNTLLSKNFGTALSQLNSQRNVLLSTTSDFVDEWNGMIDSQLHDKVLIVQLFIIVDIVIFVIVILSIRKSLTPLATLIKAIGHIKEGVYGDKIAYSSKDEIGELAETFNSMSLTIQKKEEEAKKIEIAKDEFLAMVTHELKTPLVPIQGYSDILLGEHLGSLNATQKERLKIIRSSATTLLELISDLLDAQKLDLGQLRIKKEKNNLKESVEKAILGMQPQATIDDISLTYAPRKDIYAYYDDDRIKQVLTNLIKNSLKATSPKTGVVEIQLDEKESEVVVSVKDNGKGIPPAANDKIFKKFYQTDTTSTREKGGSGLGLSICKGIVEAHGGTIWMQSTSSKGTTFSFTIPKIETTRTPI
ncbi:MAG: HAMP domain-containing histidine kinase [Thaumarchaeota archaeon]|nr:HAMP domain-containing histidine kinase [Nitrososphaerota archaeon]MDE1830755.1 HAMP domain-containing histidine kinase [Nitrososphaerota archaeon]MDE1840805.1 HAMP domain-containing histidine kinase [Nitrososphaerota archaeon]MDE1877019.1 HAMP domain-containing histidine kinase [Nitrososphaerota archaeon]